MAKCKFRPCIKIYWFHEAMYLLPSISFNPAKYDSAIFSVVDFAFLGLHIEFGKWIAPEE